MINFIKSTFKILSFNIFVILIFVFIIEIIFGYWFDKDNFGPYMREHRMKNQKIEYSDSNEKIVFFYRRNYHGFRGPDVEPKDINAVILGGSVVDERHKPDKYTITGFLNKSLKKNNDNLVITNGGVEAQSTAGLIHSFENWLFKLKDFSPKIIIFYIGVNDLVLGPDATVEKISRREKQGRTSLGNAHLLNPEKMEAFFDNVKSRSIIYDSLRIFKFKFLPRKNFVKFDGKIDPNYLKKNIKFKSYEKAVSEYSNSAVKKKYKKRVDNYLDRIDVLYEHSKNLNSIPIFITNVVSLGHVENIFTMNSALINHCEVKNYNCIDLARSLKGQTDFWYDGFHSSKKGSEVIANLIYKDLSKILDKIN